MMKGQKGYVLVSKTLSNDSLAMRLLSAVKRQVARWYELHRQRQQLAQLSDASLKDLGLSRADIYQEAERHFWSDPMGQRQMGATSDKPKERP